MVSDNNIGGIKVKGVILENIPRGYFTNMKDIFKAINNKQVDYNWLITNYECNTYPSPKIPQNSEYVWIEGSSLTKIIEKDDIQFIWGVFSGFSKDILLDDIMNYALPFADNNTALWDSNIDIQHPLADIEIISWDSSLLLLITKMENLMGDFKKSFPKCLDLEFYNSK